MLKTFSSSSSSLNHRYSSRSIVLVGENKRHSRPRSRPRRRSILLVHAKKKSGFAAELMKKKEEDDDDDDGPSTSTSKTNENERCPCGSSSYYKSCCRPYHDLERYPPDPVTLMKSRFSAYAKGKAKYVVMTTHSENEIKKDGSKTKSGVKVSTLEADVIATCEKVEFYGLKIANEKKKNETEHLVSFSYNCRVRGQKGFDRGREETQSELSTFRKEEDGKWYFLDGIQGA